MKILNFGSLNVDYVYSVDYFVRAGETLKANSREVLPGGKGLNQSVALARAGAQVYHAGCIGADGEFLRQLLNKKGVNTEYLRTIDGMQGHTIIQVDKKGENCILLYGGTNRSIGDSQIDETLAHFGQGDWLVLQNEVNSLPRIVDAAFARGMRIVLNPSPYEESLKEVDFGKLSWLLVNEVEACQCSGSDEPERAWDVLHARYPATPSPGSSSAALPRGVPWPSACAGPAWPPPSASPAWARRCPYRRWKRWNRGWRSCSSFGFYARQACEVIAPHACLVLENHSPAASRHSGIIRHGQLLHPALGFIGDLFQLLHDAVGIVLRPTLFAFFTGHVFDDQDTSLIICQKSIHTRLYSFAFTEHAHIISSSS